MLTEYLLRVSMAVANGVFRGRTGILDEHQMRLRVWPSDIDIYGHVNNGRYLTIMDLGRTDFMARTGLLSIAVKRRWRPVVGAATIEFKKDLKPGQLYELSTRLASWDEKWFYFDHRFERSGVVHAQGFIRGVMKGGRKTVPPILLFEQLGQLIELPAVSESLRNWITSQKRPEA